MAHQLEDGNKGLVESYEPPPSAWCLVRDHVPKSELPEIRAVLGDALIDLCTETYAEVEMWVQIWREACCRRGSVTKPPRATLADPPVVKELLKAEIRLLLLVVRERAAREGRDSNVVMSRYSPTVVNYVMREGECLRTQSRCGQIEGREAPSRPQSAQSQQEVRTSSRLSSSSSCEDDIEAVKHKLNVTDIDEVVAHLKSVLTEDCEAMKREIQFLQECVERECCNQSEEPTQEPTLLELKEERKVIQMDLMTTELAHRPHPTAVASADSGMHTGLRAAGGLGFPAIRGGGESSLPTFSEEDPVHGRPPRPRVQSELPPEGTPRPPSATLHGPHHPQEIPLCDGAEPTWRRSATSRPSAITVSMGSMPAGQGLNPCSDGGAVRPRGSFHANGHGARHASPSLANHSLYGHHVPSSLVRPHPPERIQAHNDITVPKLIPAPPTTQKPASIGPSVARRLRVLQGGLISPT